ASVTITSRSMAKAKEAAAQLRARFGVEVAATEARDDPGVARALDGAQLCLAAGAAGVQLLSRKICATNPPLRVMGDVKAAAPLRHDVRPPSAPAPALIAAPSGYGLPLVPLSQVSERDLDLFVLVRPEDREDPELVGALRPMIQQMRALGLPAVFLPGVVHLPTVPPHRKVNRTDLRTADKVCVAAPGIWDQTRRLGLAPAETAFILVELGGAFTAALAVRDGQIVDGIGGSGGGLGYRALGTLDGEVAYVLGR